MAARMSLWLPLTARPRFQSFTRQVISRCLGAANVSRKSLRSCCGSRCTWTARRTVESPAMNVNWASREVLVSDSEERQQEFCQKEDSHVRLPKIQRSFQEEKNENDIRRSRGSNKRWSGASQTTGPCFGQLNDLLICLTGNYFSPHYFTNAELNRCGRPGFHAQNLRL